MALSIPGSFSRIHMIACVVSLCSVVLIAKPSLLIGSHAAGVDPPVPPGELAVRSQDTGGDGKLLAGVVFAMLGAFGGAVSGHSRSIVDPASYVHGLWEQLMIVAI